MIYINQSINLYLAAHLSISSRQKKVFIASSSVRGKQAMRVTSTAVKEPMQASVKLKNRPPCSVIRSLIISCLQMLSAPLNKRTAPSFFKLFLSLRYLFRKNEILLSPMFCFLPIPQFFPRVISELLWRCCSCCFLSFLLFIFWSISYYNSSWERWRRWCECWCCRLPDCHPTSSLQGSKARALFTDGKRFWKKLMQGRVNTKTLMMIHKWRLQPTLGWGGGYQAMVRGFIWEVAWIFGQGSWV